MNTRSQLLRTSAAALLLVGISADGTVRAETAPDPARDLVSPPDALVASPALALPDPAAGEFRDQLGLAILAMPEAQRDPVRSFYAGRADAPFWTADERMTALQVAIDGSPAHGIPRSRYNDLPSSGVFVNAAARAEAEIQAMQAYLAFAGDLSAGIVNPVGVNSEINVSPNRPAVAELLAPLEAGSVAAALEAFAPQDPAYAVLLGEKRRLEEIVAAGGWSAEVPDGATLRVGESDPRVPALRDRLASLGYPSTPESEIGQAAFDPSLEAALRGFQIDHGLVDDGAFGAQTRAALNTTPESRLRQVVVNLERMRWMNRDLGARHIAVNIPDYSVEMVDNGEVVWQSRAVVGEETKTRTPEFSDSMTYFVVNPTWHIPDSIATRVYLPKLRNDPSVLARSNMSLFTRSGVEINPRLVNFTQYSASNFPFRIKQNPSSANALGRVKFMFPNQFAIYLHDTPARDLFAKDRRAFSNGCIRLEHPIELSNALLEGQVGDPAGAMQTWLANGNETYVNLDRPIPVHILYRTVVIDADGVPRYRADIYGRDRKVFEALSEQGLQLAALQG